MSIKRRDVPEKNRVSPRNCEWIEWSIASSRYRIADRNGVFAVEEMIRGEWYAIQLPPDFDFLLHGLCSYGKRLSATNELVQTLMTGSQISPGQLNRIYREHPEIVRSVATLKLEQNTDGDKA